MLSRHCPQLPLLKLLHQKHCLRPEWDDRWQREISRRNKTKYSGFRTKKLGGLPSEDKVSLPHCWRLVTIASSSRGGGGWPGSRLPPLCLPAVHSNRGRVAAAPSPGLAGKVSQETSPSHPCLCQPRPTPSATVSGAHLCFELLSCAFCTVFRHRT